MNNHHFTYKNWINRGGFRGLGNYPATKNRTEASLLSLPSSRVYGMGGFWEDFGEQAKGIVGKTGENIQSELVGEGGMLDQTTQALVEQGKLTLEEALAGYMPKGTTPTEGDEPRDTSLPPEIQEQISNGGGDNNMMMIAAIGGAALLLMLAMQK